MSFKYLICLDFEATCWPGKYTRKEDSEIIEIGAVLLNVDTGNVEDQFHHYVRPTKIPKLSSFCIGLTGITQTMVDNGEPFPSVFPKFQNWIEKVQSEKNLRFTTPMERRATPDGPNVSFCSWSNFDLEFYFKLECQRTNINISPHFKAWIDARKLYDQKYGNGKCRFADAVKRANIDSVGQAHSGISDATNLAKLMVFLVKNGIQCNQANNFYL